MSRQQVDGVGCSRSRQISQHDRADDTQSVVPIAQQRRRAPPVTTEPTGATGSKIDADLCAFVANNNNSSNSNNNSPTVPSPNDRILYVGINDGSTAKEIGTLRGSSNVTTVLRKDGCTVQLDPGVAKAFDLESADGCWDFARTLGDKYGLTPEACGQIAFTIWSVNPASMRDELARIAIAIAPGEKGAAIPSRLVLSGHSSGEDLHLKNEGLKFHSILALARAMPTAAKQIEDVHLSGCFTAAQVYNVKDWRAAFPNLKTMWGYAQIVQGHMPEPHMRSWQARTHGRVSSDPSQGTSGVVSWSARDGIKTGVTLESLRKAQAYADSRFELIKSGAIETKTPIHGAATEDYAVFRQLQHRPELSKEEQAIMGAKADVLQRARFYHSAIRTEFAYAHAKEIHAAYESLGGPPIRGKDVPDFATLSRTAALAAIRQLEATAAGTKPLPQAVAKVLPLLRSFANLDSNVIPSEWCY